MEELLKIKEQELARLAQIKELLQQKLSEETNRANMLQKELELLKAQPNAVPPSMNEEIAQIRTEVKIVAEKIPKVEEKVDQILSNLTQFLTKVRVASKMAAKPPAPESQPPAGGESKESTPSRPLKPSALLQRQAQEEVAAAQESAEGATLAKPSEVLKKHLAEEEQETVASKPKKITTKTVEGARESPSQEAGVEDEPSETKGKEVELPGASIITVPYPSDGSIICPRCNKQNYQEMQDPTNVVAYAPVKKFGRKFYCKSCRCNWRYK